MKKFLFPFALLFAASIIFTACRDNEPCLSVTDVTLNRTTLELVIGETETLIATVMPEDADDKTVTWTSGNETIAKVDENGVVTAVSEGFTTITVRAGTQVATCWIRVIDGVRINDVIWATRNVDAPGTFAQNPRDAGMLFQWNRRVGWSSENPMINSDGGTTWDNSYSTSVFFLNDPCPEGWRVPTREELQSLVDAGSTWSWGNQMTQTLGGRYFGTAPNQIFLPAAGFRSNFHSGALDDVGTNGLYWSETFYPQLGGTFAHSLRFDGSFNKVLGIPRAEGLSVRCVADEMVYISTPD